MYVALNPLLSDPSLSSETDLRNRMADTLTNHAHEFKATFSVWTPSAAAAAMAATPTVKLHFVFNAIHRYVVLHDETQIATQSQPLMAYRLPGRFDSSAKVDRSTLLSPDSTAAFADIILSMLLEYCGDVLLQWSDLASLVFDILRSVRRLVLRNATNRVRVHVDFLNYHVLYGFLTQQSFDDGENYGLIPASKSATMEMLKKVDFDCDDDGDERCTVCLEEMGREKEVLCMPCLHRFHGKCILKWLDYYSHYCPICRYKMPTK